jgi:hypothetical protein
MPDGSPPALTDDDLAGIRDLYGVPGPERVNWIWQRGTTPRRALWGLTRDELHDQIENVQNPDGFHIQRVSGYVLPTGTRYVAVVEKIANQERHYVTDRTRADFDDVNRQWRAQGLRLADVNTYIDADGVVRFNAVWVKDGTETRPFVGVTRDQLDQELDNARDDHYRPIVINGYVTSDGEEGWNALCVKQGAPGPGARLGGPRRLRAGRVRRLLRAARGRVRPESGRSCPSSRSWPSRWTWPWTPRRIGSTWPTSAAAASNRASRSSTARR